MACTAISNCGIFATFGGDRTEIGETKYVSLGLFERRSDAGEHADLGWVGRVQKHAFHRCELGRVQVGEMCVGMRCRTERRVRWQHHPKLSLRTALFEAVAKEMSECGDFRGFRGAPGHLSTST